MSKVPSQCPFCKSQKLIPKFNYVYCLDCEAEGPFAETQEEAIEAWNQREPDEATRAMLEWAQEDYTQGFVKQLSEHPAFSKRYDMLKAFLKAWDWPREENPNVD